MEELTDLSRPEETTVFVVLWEPLAYGGDTTMSYGGPREIREQLAELVDTPRDQTTIDVWLQSVGGSAHEAYRYMLVFREYAARVRIIVGEHAKSAATLMLLGGDEIYMSATSDLGPLDAQIYVDDEDKYISALDIARSVEHLARVALDLALSSGGIVHGITGLPRKDVLPEVLSFTGDFMRPIVSKLDPSAIHRAASQLKLAQDYGIRLLGMKTPAFSEESAMDLTEHLINDYSDHGYIISRDEAKELGLPVVDVSEYEHFSLWKKFTTVLEQQREKSLLVFDRAQVAGIFDEIEETDALKDDSEDDAPDSITFDGEVDIYASSSNE